MKKEFDEAGIDIFTYYVNINDSYTDAEIDAVFAGAKELGARGCVGSQGLDGRDASRDSRAGTECLSGFTTTTTCRTPTPSNEASFVKALGFSPNVRATLDTRHFTAANGDCLGFLEKHHERVSSVHLGDRQEEQWAKRAIW